MRILLVEDSPEVSLITVEYLTELEHHVAAVEKAEEALTRLASDTFDVVITDVSLPGMSGIDLAKEIGQRLPTLPIVIASGYGTLNLEALLGPEHANIFILPKPYDMSMLEAILAKALEFGSQTQ